MTFRKGGAGRRRDAAEGPVIVALTSEGCRLWQISGRSLPDLLVFDTLTRRWFPLGVKSFGAKLTPFEKRGVPWVLVSSPEQALGALRMVRVGRG